MNKLFSKLISVVTATAITFFVSSGSMQTFVNELNVNAAETSVILGDVNADKRIDVRDFTLLKREIQKSGSTKINRTVADVDMNGVVDINDANEIHQYLLCKRTSFIGTALKNIEQPNTAIVTTNQPIETSLTKEMAAKADELYKNGGADAIFRYLYENMRTEFYYGSRKGAIGTYEQGGGNDTDLSSLLIAMLRYEGCDAKYCVAQKGFTESQLKMWTNTDSLEDALSVIGVQGRIVTVGTVDGMTMYFMNKYTFVVVTDNEGEMSVMDICYKGYESNQTVYDTLDAQFKTSAAKQIVSKNDTDTLLKEFSKSEASAAKLENTSVSMVSQKISFQYVNDDAMFIFADEGMIFDTLADTDSDLVQIAIGSRGKTFRAAELYKKNITVSYKVEEITSLSAAYGSSIFTIGSGLYNMGKMEFLVTPELMIDGSKVMEGSDLAIGSSQDLTISTRSASGQIRQDTESLTAGTMCSIVFDTGIISENELTEAYCNALQNTRNLNQKNGYSVDTTSNSLSEKNVYTANYMGSLLRLAGVMYFSQFDVADLAIAQRSGIRGENVLRFGVFGFKPNAYSPEGNLYNAENPDGIQKSGMFYTDVLGNYSRSFCDSDDAIKLRTYNFERGLISSEYESAVIRDLFGVDSLSTTAILRYAQEHNIPIVTLSANSVTKVSDLKIDDSDKSIIQDKINNGCSIIIPLSAVTIDEWTGSGYIVIGADGIASQYMITGGYHGGMSTTCVELDYAINVSLDLACIAESIGALTGVLAVATCLSGVLVPAILAVISIELLLFDIIEQTYLLCDYEINDNMEAGVEIWVSTGVSSLTTLATIGLGKLGSIVSEEIANNKLTNKYGENLVKGIQDYGFTSSEISSKVRYFEKLGLSEKTISTLMSDAKCMFLGDDILSFLGKQGGNQRLLAELVIGNGDDFTKALMKTGVLDDFCNLAWKYGGEAARVLVDKGDDAIKAICNLNATQVSRLSDITAKNGNLSKWSDLIVESGDLSYKGANIYDSKGLNLTELDEVDFTKQIIYEDKDATGLYMDNPDFPLTEQQWAEKQILGKGGKRIAALQNDNLKVTIETQSGEVLDCSFTVPELKDINDYVFRINADTSELRAAVEDCLNELRSAYPDMNFSAIFGE